jgi:hypothetical protein
VVKRIEALRFVLVEVAAGRIPDAHAQQAAARELVELIDPSPLAARGRAIERLARLGLRRQAIVERLGISVQQYQRARERST